MYLSGGNDTPSASFLPARNYVIWLDHLGLPGILVEIKSCYVIMREILAHKSIYNHLTSMVTVHEIINANKSKAPGRTKMNAKTCRYLQDKHNANA